MKKIWKEITAILLLALLMGVIYNEMAHDMPYIYKEKELQKADNFDNLFSDFEPDESAAEPEITESIEPVEPNAGEKAAAENPGTEDEKQADDSEKNREKQVPTEQEQKADHKTDTGKKPDEMVADKNENKKEDTDKAVEVASNETNENVTAEDIFEKSIDFQQLKKKLNDPRLYLIDARAPEAFKQGHIPSSVNIYPYMDEQVYYTKLSQIPYDKIIVVYCDGGHCDLSHDVIRVLVDFGYKKIFLYAGGWEDWTKNKGEIVK